MSQHLSQMSNIYQYWAIPITRVIPRGAHAPKNCTNQYLRPMSFLTTNFLNQKFLDRNIFENSGLIHEDQNFVF